MDRGFLRDIETSRTAAGIVSAVISMSHSLGLRVVAEGVDGLWQLQLLEQMECDEIQGFLYSPPIPSQEATRFLATENGRPPAISPCESALNLPDQFHWSDDEAGGPDRPTAQKALGKSVLPRPVGIRSRRVRVLVVEDGAELGPIALRLMRLGADVHFAQGMDEAALYVHDEGPQIDVLMLSPEADLAAAVELIELAEKDSGSELVLMVSGERPSSERRAAIRAAGASWVLWAPFEDGEIEYVLAAAKAQQQPPGQRRMLRVPMNAMAWIRAGAQTRSAVLTSLSPMGAFVETSGPVEVGRPIRLEFELSTRRVRTFANVANVRPEEEGSSRGIGLGVVFYDLDAETETLIREAVEERRSRYLP
jgi:CheY-like chemotaxis protein